MEYPDPSVLNTRHWNIIELPQGGYLSTGVKDQAADVKWDAFVMRTDAEGNKVWELGYGTLGVWDMLFDVHPLADNILLLTGASFNTSGEVSSYSDIWGIDRYVWIDGMGNILHESQSPLEYIDQRRSSPTRMVLDGDGQWISPGSLVHVTSPQSLVRQLEIVKRDTAFNVIWATSFGEASANTNQFYALAPTPDGGWVAAGEYAQYISHEPVEGYYGGALFKVGPERDSLWGRADTLYSHLAGFSEARLTGVVALPSGSVVACGTVNRYFDGNKSVPWLVKVDRDGCITPGCNPILDGRDLTPMLTGFSMSPNPTSGMARVLGQGVFDLLVYGPEGQPLLQRTGVREATDIDLSPYPPGVYFVRVAQDRRMLTMKVVKVR